MVRCPKTFGHIEYPQNLKTALVINRDNASGDKVIYFLIYMRSFKTQEQQAAKMPYCY